MFKYSFSTKKIIIYTLIILALLAGYYFDGYKVVDNFIYDNYQKMEYIFSSKDKKSEVTIIEIDNLTYKKLGTRPLDRNYYVQAIEKLNDNRADVIMFDMLLDKAQDAQADSLMIEELRNNNNIIMPVKIDFSALKENVEKQYEINEITAPLSSFKNLVKLGHNSLVVDHNNIVRRLPPLLIKNNTSYIPIARRAAEMSLGEEITITEGKYLLNYLGPENSLPKISLHDLLSDNYNPELIEGNIVLLGVTEGEEVTDFQSIFSTGESFSKVEILAQMTNNYLHQNFIEVNEIGRNMLIAFVVLWLVFYLFEKLHPLRSLIALIIINGVVFGLNYFLTIQFFLYSEISVYFVGTSILYLISLITWYGFKRKQKYAIVKKLNPYFSKFLLNEIVKNPDLLKTKGEKSSGTVLYFEFNNFRRYIEENTSQKVIEDLNHYYKNITNIIFKYDGVVDSYLGDGILAYWSKAYKQDNHRNRAVKASIEIMNYFQKENIELKPSITIDSGKILLGDIGSKKITKLKVMGDIVHLTTELSEVTKAYELLIGENTYYGLSEIYKKLNWEYQELDIKGIKKSTVVYSLKEFKSLSKGE